MTQRNNSGDNRLHHQWQRSLPAQSLCWLSSFSLLSSGLVYAQEAAIDNIVPTVENSGSAAVVNKVKKYTSEQNRSASAPESEPGTEFSQRRAKLRQRLSRLENSQPKNVAASPAVVFKKSRSQVEISAPTSGVRSLRDKLEASRRPVTHREEKPSAETAPTAQSLSAEKVHNANSADNAASEKPKDYNNALIDPTDYSTGATHKYEAPNSVVITERSSSCRTILAQGQGVSGSLCTKSPQTPSLGQPVADADTKLPTKHVPSWISKSQTAHLVNVISERRISPKVTNTNSGLRSTPIASSGESNTLMRPTRIANGGVTKSDYHPNRFIPNNFTPTTTVNSGTLASMGGALPPPMTSDNVAPRPSMVAYNIPLASTLPQIAYAGRSAYGVAGLMFPLPVPAEITSLFGWRIHPITGDRRFHSGTDLGAATGTPVLAAYPGKVEIADWVGGYGLTVILNHTSAQQTLYGHMSQVLVQPGQWVEKGTVIGLVGSTGNSTGPHLHFEVRQLTPEGWVATDPGTELGNALSQLVQTLQTATRTTQTTQQPGS
ncbi:MAG: M23 family metallopeptidase [Stigonema ocellatum SAG 48.90 = DSM 106950]|nr:M23 family metallopeptidase [Stigonema ocellatum SAG 48.90 = DSM 106950]